jgi:hypothetical protein
MIQVASVAYPEDVAPTGWGGGEPEVHRRRADSYGGLPRQDTAVRRL